MSDTGGMPPRQGVRWGRFLVIFLVLGAISTLGGSKDWLEAAPGKKIAHLAGRLVALLLVSALVYAVDSALRKRRQQKEGVRPPDSGQQT